jgi:hypothetical protein
VYRAFFIFKDVRILTSTTLEGCQVEQVIGPAYMLSPHLYITFDATVLTHYTYIYFGFVSLSFLVAWFSFPFGVFVCRVFILTYPLRHVRGFLNVGDLFVLASHPVLVKVLPFNLYSALLVPYPLIPIHHTAYYEYIARSSVLSFLYELSLLHSLAFLPSF